MNLTSRLHWLPLALALGLPPVQASTSALNLPLDQVVEVAMQRQGEPPGGVPYRASAWLAGLPSLEVLYLKSDERLGTDETEVGLNLPIKSPFLRAQDERLRTLGSQLAAVDLERRRLYYSGLIRESLWTARIAETRARLASEKETLLRQLMERQQALFDARDSSRYGLLLVRQELVAARLENRDREAEYLRWKQRFRQLTGLGSLPREIEEAPVPAGHQWNNHPDLRWLDLNWEQQQALIAAGSERGAPWNVRLGAKNLDSPMFEETQYGLSVEVPLGFFDTASQSITSEWRQAAQAHWRDRDELQLALANSWQRLQAEVRQREERQSLLDEAAGISSQLVVESKKLLELNELGQELWVNRIIQDLDRRAEATINQLLIGQTRAMIRQAAGIPL